MEAMATPVRRSDPALDDILFEEPYRFDFFQAVRLLERIGTDRHPVGHDEHHPRSESVRFISHLSLIFPASAIHALEGRDLKGDAESPPPRMTTPFFGLIGPIGALPTVYTEVLISLSVRKRAAAIGFLDLFHHRLVSLFYRSWEKYQVVALWERALSTKGADRAFGADAFSRHLFDLIGIGQRSLRNRQNLPDGVLVYYAGLLAQQHRSAVVLEQILGDYFERPVSVVTFFGRWLRLQPDQQSRPGRNGVFNQLGVDAVAGHKVWDDQSKFRVRIGPLTFAEFRDFLPGGDASEELTDLIRFYVRAELDFDVQLVLKAEEVPWCNLSRDSQAAAQLGRYSWLKCREYTQDAEEAVFRPQR
jgi:type VI secretion system protein ImpH